METLSLVLAFIFGAIVGSFLNVVSLRFYTGVGVGGRSKCMSCSKQLVWYELVPIVSFLVQRGSCRGCKAKLSWQYPLIELAAGLLFVFIFLTFPPVTATAAVVTLIQIISACLLLVITAYDAKHKIIPDPLVYSFDALALLSIFFGGSSWFHLPDWGAILAGPVIALPFALLWLVSRGRWMGFGDAKLALGIGWMLGLMGGLNALVFAFWIGAVVSIIWLFATYKYFRRRTEIPFGPYLILGMYLVLLFHLAVFTL